ncbi:MAG: DUF4194 domain-containing protein [Anaerocolumna sp.]
MFEYYKELLDEEKEELTSLIKMFYNQTFILDRKFDKKTGRYQINRMYRVCERHYEFLREYFHIADIDLVENRQFGIMALKTPTVQGDKLSRLTTLFILLLKLIFDEQMNTVSNSAQVYTTLEEIFDKLKLFRLMYSKTISPTELKKTIAVLKKYQIIEVMEESVELDGATRIMIYPTVSLVLNGQSIQGIIEQYQDNEEDNTDEQSPSTDEDVPEQLALH